MIELELLAIVWATQKCKVYLEFEFVTDHRPLVPMLNTYTLDQVQILRILRMLLKLTHLTFVTSWMKGSDNIVADALSRAPVEHLQIYDNDEGEVDVLSVQKLKLESNDPILSRLTRSYFEKR